VAEGSSRSTSIGCCPYANAEDGCRSRIGLKHEAGRRRSILLDCALVGLCPRWTVPSLDCALVGLCPRWTVPSLECARTPARQTISPRPEYASNSSTLRGGWIFKKRSVFALLAAEPTSYGAPWYSGGSPF
jgi:hypothetical protein